MVRREDLSAAPEVKTTDLYRGAVPSIVIQIVALALPFPELVRGLWDQGALPRPSSAR